MAVLRALLAWLGSLTGPRKAALGGVVVMGLAGVNVFVGSSTIPNQGPNCSLNATTATFTAQVAAATSGQTLCLASGNYGVWAGVNKAITVTKQTDATPTIGLSAGSAVGGFTLDGLTIPGGDISGASNITVRNSTFTAGIDVDGTNILFDTNTHNNIDAVIGCGAGGTGSPTVIPARIRTPGPSADSGLTVQNSTFNGGDADGIQTGSTIRIISNEFVNIVTTPASCNHTDGIQVLGGNGSVIRGNYIHTTEDGIVAFDAGYSNLLVEFNVIKPNGIDGIVLYSDSGSTIRHNTLVGKEIYLDHKVGQANGTTALIRDNIVTQIGAFNGSTITTRDHNMWPSGAAAADINGTPTYVGGTTPTTYVGHRLTAGSAGHLAASDSTDVGIP